MSELSPAERIDLKADMENAAQLRRQHVPMSGRASHHLAAQDRIAIERALERYPVLVELVRRLLVRPMTENDVR